MILVVDMNYREDSLCHEEFVLPVVAIVKPNDSLKIMHYDRVKSASLEEYSGIILCGTALKDNRFSEHISEFKWLEECETPVLGICAGMQAIGLAFGSKLAPCTEIGMIEVETTIENSLFTRRFSAYALHNNAIKKPEHFEVLAKSDKCIQAIKHHEKEIYGVLFHPEVRNHQVIERFISETRKNQPQQ